MDPFLNRIARAAERAEAEPAPPPLDPDRVTARIRAVAASASASAAPRRTAASPIPWRFAAGLGSAAAGIAGAVGVCAWSVLERARDPYAVLALFMDVLS